jgi:hypothetical protein
MWQVGSPAELGPPGAQHRSTTCDLDDDRYKRIAPNAGAAIVPMAYSSVVFYNRISDRWTHSRCGIRRARVADLSNAR